MPLCHCARSLRFPCSPRERFISACIKLEPLCLYFVSALFPYIKTNCLQFNCKRLASHRMLLLEKKHKLSLWWMCYTSYFKEVCKEIFMLPESNFRLHRCVFRQNASLTLIKPPIDGEILWWYFIWQFSRFWSIFLTVHWVKENCK